MSRRKRNRKRRMIIAYTARAIVALILATMLFLMGCGCLYVRDHFFKKDSERIEKQQEQSTEPETIQTSSEPKGSETKQEGNSSLSYDFTYPDASDLHIVLDAGHGETDGGTLGVISEDIVEKDINLAVVLKMKQYLEECGAKVTLTRKADDWTTLSDRTSISNNSGADLFVSIHCNSFEDDASISGLEIYHYKTSEVSKEYADKMLTYIASTNTVKAREVSPQNLQVLRDNSIPAVLVELGYLTNQEDCKNLSNSLYQDTMAKILVDSIVSARK